MSLQTKIFITCFSLCTAHAASGEEFAIDSTSSSASQELDASVPFSGTWIGDYDAKTNPSGTQTRPGFFGGSGNNPINYSAQFNLSGSNTTQPSGEFLAEFDMETMTGTLSGVSIDLLGGVEVGLDLGITLLFDAFNTVNPFSIYPGGFEIPVPLGTAQVLSSQIQSTSTAALVLTELDENSWSITGVITANSINEVELGTGPQIFSVPVVAPIVGTLVNGADGRVIEISFGADLNQEVPVTDAPPFEGIALPLPTLPPSDNTANVVLSGVLESASFATVQSLQLIAREVDSGIPQDIDGDNAVNGKDMGLLFVEWGFNPGSPADFNGDDLVDGGDLGQLILAWTG